MYFSLQSTKSNKFWQTGEWVQTIDRATKYDSEDEAEKVAALRSLGQVTIVENATPFKQVA